jgi:Rrf2 family protein
MQLTMSGEYAIRAMIHLASLRFGTTVQISDISTQWDIPENFLRKISAQLAGAGLIATQRGLGGGITISRPPEVITPLEVIEAIEGEIALNKCLMCDGFCPRDQWCAVHRLWAEAQEKLKEVLSSKSLAQLAAESLDHKAALEEIPRHTTEALQLK